MTNYSEKKKNELQDEARARGLEGYSDLNKPELEQLLEEDDAGDFGLEPTQDLSPEVVKEYQEEYVPKRRKQVEDARKKGFDLNESEPEGSDPDNPVVEARLGDKEAYQQLTDEEKELAGLALDAAGPLGVESPYQRIMTGAQSEQQAKEQEKERAKLPDEFVGNLPERVTDEQVEYAERLFDPEKQAKFEAEAHDRVNEVGTTMQDRYDALEARRNR